MRKKPKKPKLNKPNMTLVQTTLNPQLARRLYASPEYSIHQNASAALRAILDTYLPQLAEKSQEKNHEDTTYSLTG